LRSVQQQRSPSLQIRVGVDLVGADRVERLAVENPGILQTLFTARELAACASRRRPYEHLAARFAAKEAVLKAFGTGLAERMRWTEVEIVNGMRGRPLVQLHGEVATWAKQLGFTDVAVSLSHTDGMAIAQVVAVMDKAECQCAST
jgi:holo-[acyl-carrier protein] synthase